MNEFNFQVVWSIMGDLKVPSLSIDAVATFLGKGKFYHHISADRTNVQAGGISETFKN